MKRATPGGNAGPNGDLFIFSFLPYDASRALRYDTSDLSKPQLVMLGSADGCKVNYGAANTKPIPMKGVAGAAIAVIEAFWCTQNGKW